MVEAWTKPCSHTNRRKKTETCILQKVPHRNEEERKKCTHGPDSPPLFVCFICWFLHLLSETSPAPAALRTTQIPCCPQSTEAAASPRWLKLRQRNQAVFFLSELRDNDDDAACQTPSRRRFRNKSATPAGAPAGAPAGGASDARPGGA